LGSSTINYVMRMTIPNFPLPVEYIHNFQEFSVAGHPMYQANDQLFLRYGQGIFSYSTTNRTLKEIAYLDNGGDGSFFALVGGLIITELRLRKSKRSVIQAFTLGGELIGNRLWRVSFCVV